MIMYLFSSVRGGDSLTEEVRDVYHIGQDSYMYILQYFWAMSEDRMQRGIHKHQGIPRKYVHIEGISHDQHKGNIIDTRDLYHNPHFNDASIKTLFHFMKIALRWAHTDDANYSWFMMNSWFTQKFLWQSNQDETSFDIDDKASSVAMFDDYWELSTNQWLKLMQVIFENIAQERRAANMPAGDFEKYYDEFMAIDTTDAFPFEITKVFDHFWEADKQEEAIQKINEAYNWNAGIKYMDDGEFFEEYYARQKENYPGLWKEIRSGEKVIERIW